MKRVKRTKVKVAVAGVGQGMVETHTTEEEPDLREPKRILGTILSGVRILNHADLLAIARPMLNLGQRESKKLDQYPEAELRKILSEVAWDLYRHHPESLQEADRLVASIQLSFLEKS